ncbi:hypothetical protein [Parasediminibacterium sp. JCM 36343]|uniref:hypothetical protein n=1 Tax=Parasediminibacterium sp. JCM 36343 TaxID=3374279 RepID=UPI00397970D5
MRHSTTKHLNDIIPAYTERLELIRESIVWYSVLKESVLDLNIPDHPVARCILYNELVLNLKGTIIIAKMDLATIIKNIRLTKNKWEKAYYFRQGSLLIYEFINTYNKQNKIISPVLKKSYPDIYELYVQHSVKLREFKRLYKYDSEMAQLRNNTSAHISDNIFKYCLIISKINPVAVKKCMVDFSQFLSELEKLQSEIEINFLNEVLALNGKTFESYIKEDYSSDKFKRLKLPKMLK